MESQNSLRPDGKRIIIVSDGTGETAAQMTKAAMVQFGDQTCGRAFTAFSC